MEMPDGEISVLYVDDEMSVRELTAKMLRWKGLAVNTAGDGRTALRLFRNYKPDIIVTDIIMPEMDGLEMSREVRRICSKVPIIITSAHLPDRYLVVLKSLGISHFIQKPIQLERLVVSIETCCAEAGVSIRPKGLGKRLGV
jgi:DNA-binding NtrC family response regulator